MKLSEVPIKEIKVGHKVKSARGLNGKIHSKEANRGCFRGNYDEELVIEWENGLKSCFPHSMLTEVESMENNDA